MKLSYLIIGLLLWRAVSRQSAAAPAPAPAPGSTPSDSVEIVTPHVPAAIAAMAPAPPTNPNVTAFGGGVLTVPVASGTVLNHPYQTRDPRLPVGAIIGPSVAAQQAALLADNNSFNLAGTPDFYGDPGYAPDTGGGETMSGGPTGNLTHEVFV